MLSILSLDFNGYPSIRLEYPSTLYSAEGIILDLPLPDSYPLSSIIRETSYLALTWRYLFNLRVRNRDYRAPNLLTYYAFTQDDDNNSTGGLRVIGGPQSDSHALVAAWVSEEDMMPKEYFRGAQELREFVELARGERDIGGTRVYHEDYHAQVQRFYSF